VVDGGGPSTLPPVQDGEAGNAWPALDRKKAAATNAVAAMTFLAALLFGT
jgi:hypothetical protein